MILRSQTVKNYLEAHPNALKIKENTLKTIVYLQEKVFKHAVDVSKWDGDACVDMWTSDTDWLIANFEIFTMLFILARISILKESAPHPPKALWP